MRKLERKRTSLGVPGNRQIFHKVMLVILESTTYPGTTDEVVLPMLESEDLKVGRDFFLCFSPERVDPGEQSVQVELKQALPVHHLVRLSGEAWQCLGHIRCCSREGLIFVAGIEFCQPAHPKDSPDYGESLD